MMRNSTESNQFLSIKICQKTLVMQDDLTTSKPEECNSSIKLQPL